MLHVNGIPSVIYEAEDSPTSRAQGGMLDIQSMFGGEVPQKLLDLLN